MGSTQDYTKCPKCGYEKAVNDYNYKSGEEVTHCRNCGYSYSWHMKRNEEGKIVNQETSYDINKVALAYFASNTHEVMSFSYCNENTTLQNIIDHINRFGDLVLDENLGVIEIDFNKTKGEGRPNLYTGIAVQNEAGKWEKIWYRMDILDIVNQENEIKLLRKSPIWIEEEKGGYGTILLRLVKGTQACCSLDKKLSKAEAEKYWIEAITQNHKNILLSDCSMHWLNENGKIEKIH